MGTELLRRRNEFLAGVLLAELGIRNVATVAVRETEILRHRRDVVELVRGRVVAEHVAAVIGEPQLAGSRIPIETH